MATDTNSVRILYGYEYGSDNIGYEYKYGVISDIKTDIIKKKYATLSYSQYK